MSFLKYQDLIATRKNGFEKFIKCAKYFSRTRKLGLAHTIGHILFLAAERNNNGYAIASQNYFAQYDEAEKSVARSSFTEAREKVSFGAFEYLLEELNEEEKPWLKEAKWRGHNVKGVDGSCITMPATKEVLEKFPRRENAQSGTHYPYALMVTATNVLTGQPVCATIDDYHASERKSLEKLFCKFTKGDVLLLDRGYEGAEMFAAIAAAGFFFVCRMCTKGPSVRGEVRAFIDSKKKQATVIFKSGEKSLKVRLIRAGEDRQGDPIVLAANLLGKRAYPRREVARLYLLRWRIETMYYRVKELLCLEKFHAKTLNGVLQEIWANLCILSLTALLQARACGDKLGKRKVPGFKGVAETLRRNFCFFVLFPPKRNGSAKSVAKEMVKQILRINYVKQPGRKNPRFSKQPRTHWAGGSKNKLMDKYKIRAKKRSKAA